MESCHNWSYLPDREGPAGVGSVPPPEPNSCNIVSTLPCGPPADTADPGWLGGTGAESGRAETLSWTSLPNSFFLALFTASPPALHFGQFLSAPVLYRIPASPNRVLSHYLIKKLVFAGHTHATGHRCRT